MKPFLLCVILGITAPVALAAPSKCSPRHRHLSKPKATAKKAPAVDKVAAANCLKELRRLRSVAKVGTTYADYSARVVGAQVAIDENSPHLATSPLKTELLAAMSEFVKARKSWEMSNSAPAAPPEVEAAEQQMLNGMGETPAKHWTLAFTHLSKAEHLASH